jgi:hypothetical protein
MEATIRRLSIDNDNLHERVRKLTDRIERYERAFVEVVLPSELPEGAGE